MEKKTKEKKENAIAWLFSQAEGRKTALAMSVFTAFISVICSLVPYYFIGQIINMLMDGDRDMGHYGSYILWISILFAGQALFHAISTSLSHINTFAVIAAIRRKCTEKLSRMPLGEVRKYQDGELKGTLMERIDAIEPTLAHVIPEFTTDIAGPVILLIAIWTISWKLALAAFITLPLGLLCYMGMMVGYEENFGRVLRATKALNDATVEYIGGIEVIKVFGKEESSYEKFVEAAEEGANSYIDWMRKCNIFFTLGAAIMPATMLTVLPVGGFMYLRGAISSESFITVILMCIALIAPIIAAMSYTDDIEQIGSITDDIRMILDGPEMERPQGLEMELTGSDIRLQNVHFAYQDKEVLHGIDMEIKQGQFVALVGPSGSGKSTIANLIASLWDVGEGSVTYGGCDIRRIPLDLYNRKIAYVSQENYLFNQSICDNIAMGAMDHEATDQEIIDVAKRSGCYDFIMGLENGFDTVAGSSGGHLSGGERQRISIARAMLKNADVVILDEATAFTDPENEALIQRSVAQLVQGKTLIVIAHRLSTVQDADCIYCVNEGRIQEQGSHRELLEANGLYRNMWEAHLKSRDHDREEAEANV